MHLFEDVHLCDAGCLCDPGRLRAEKFAMKDL